MGNFYMEATQINYRRDETLKTVDQKLQELSETSAIDTDIAPVFKSTNTYQPGDMVYYRNKLYVFNVEHTGAWAAADVTATDVTTELSSLKSGLINVADDVKLNTQDLTTSSRTKNILPMSLSAIKSLNTTGTWSDNAYTLNGVTYTVNTDSTGAVTGIATSGTSSARSDFIVYSTTTDFNKYNECILTGCPADGGSSKYRMVFSSSNASQLFYDIGSGTSLTGITETSGICAITTYNTGLDMSGKVFYPMIRPATITDPTFAPYIPSVDARLEAVESGLTDAQSDLTNLEAKISLAGIAKGIGIWTNDSFAQISVKGVTKQFNVTIQADGTLVGSVEDIT